MAHDESGSDLTPPSSRPRTYLGADLTPDESDVLPRVAVLNAGFVGEARHP